MTRKNSDSSTPNISVRRRTILRAGVGAGLGLSLGYLPKLFAASGNMSLPIIVPVTGFMSLEGSSQRNGAQMAVSDGVKNLNLNIKAPVFDTGTSAMGAASALDRALSEGSALAASASIFGTEMLAMAPLAKNYKVPLLTISGLPKLTESGNKYIFRFLPNDRGMKVIQAHYAIEKLNKSKPALIGDTTAYGQEGFDLLRKDMKKLGVKPVLAETVEPDTKNMSSIVGKIKRSGADVLVIHSVAQPMALLIKQCRTVNLDIPIVTSSSLVEPTALALLDPGELAKTFASTPSAPEAPTTAKMKAWAKEYRSRFALEPNGLALGQYDGVSMALQAIGSGVKTAADMIEYLSTQSYHGVAMTYQSNGKGDMAHDAEVVGWDGSSRVPKIMAHYGQADMSLK